MKKDKNAFTKILIVLVIASLALLAIVYLMVENSSKNVDTPTTINTLDITDNNKNTEDVEESPIFADISNYKFNTGKIYASHPVNCKYVDNDFAKLEKELNVEETGFLTYDYKGFRLQALENKYNWTKEDLVKIMDEAECGSTLFYGTTKDSEYLIFGSCLGTGSLGRNEDDYAYLVGDCFDVENEISDYFGKPIIGSSFNELADNSFLDINSYSSIAPVKVSVDFCEDSDLSLYIDEINEYDNQAVEGGVLSLKEDENNLTLKIIENDRWSNDYLSEQFEKNICSGEDEYLGVIGDYPEYLLFAEKCTDKGIGNELSPCEKRLIEIRGYFYKYR